MCQYRPFFLARTITKDWLQFVHTYIWILVIPAASAARIAVILWMTYHITESCKSFVRHLAEIYVGYMYPWHNLHFRQACAPTNRRHICYILVFVLLISQSVLLFRLIRCWYSHDELYQCIYRNGCQINQYAIICLTTPPILLLIAEEDILLYLYQMLGYVYPTVWRLVFGTCRAMARQLEFMLSKEAPHCIMHFPEENDFHLIRIFDH